MRKQYIYLRTGKERSPMSEWGVICLMLILMYEAGYLAEIILKHRSGADRQ